MHWRFQRPIKPARELPDAPHSHVGHGRVAAGLPLTEAEFASSVRKALRYYHRPDLLLNNPLRDSRLFAEACRRAGNTAGATTTLRDLLRMYYERLEETPADSTFKRVLELTYFRPLRSQQMVADALNMSWSTYRRRLAAALQAFAARLWEAECALLAEEKSTTAAETLRSSNRQSNAASWRTRLSKGRPEALILAVLLAGALTAAAWWLPGLLKHAVANQHASAEFGSGEMALAVLPFLNMDQNSSMQRMSNGITEELINRLGRIPGLRVAAPTSTFVLSGKPVDVGQVARVLGVRDVLEGSVQEWGTTLRVHVALVDARDGYELWSEEYNTASRDLLQTEDAIARSVVTELHLKGGVAALEALHPAPETTVPEAHDFYLVGLEYLNRRTVGNIDQAIAYFRRAIQADPNYATAWSGLAMAYTILRDYNSDALPDTYYADAVTAARKAVKLDSRLSQAHAVLGQLHEEHWEWAQAGREFRLALELDHSNATAHQWYAIYLWFTGDMKGALAQMRTAHDLDPLSPIINADLGRALLYVGNTDMAISRYRRTIALAPHFALTYLFLAEAYMAKGRYDAALQEMRTAVALTPTPHPASYLSMLGLAYLLVGDRGKARSELAVLSVRARHSYVSGVSLALLYWALGEKNQAFESLARAVADHDHLMMPVIADRKAPWTRDPRYLVLLASMHLPTPASSESAESSP